MDKYKSKEKSNFTNSIKSPNGCTKDSGSNPTFIMSYLPIKLVVLDTFFPVRSCIAGLEERRKKARGQCSQEFNHNNWIYYFHKLSSRKNFKIIKDSPFYCNFIRDEHNGRFGIHHGVSTKLGYGEPIKTGIIYSILCFKRILKHLSWFSGNVHII